MPPSPLLDARGHLTPAGLAALSGAPAGGAPADLADHLAACPQCQDRVLAGGVPAGARRERRQPPPAWRLWAVLAAILLALVTMLTLMQRVQ